LAGLRGWSEERRLLAYFRAHPEAGHWTGRAQIDGHEYVVHCLPRRMEASCVRCHGRPENAPASLVARYGTEAGFGWPVGEVVALDMVGIPVAAMDALAASETAKALWVMVPTGVALAGAFLWAFRWLICKRLSAIAAHLQSAVTQTDEDALAPIAEAGNDEIGTVARSYNALAARLRRLHDSLEQRVKERTASLEAEIAERVRVGEALRESERKLTTLMGNLPGMAYRCRNDARWTMEFVSQGCRPLTGYRADQLVGETATAFVDLIHPDDRDRVRHSVQEAIAQSRPFTMEYRIRRATGEERWVWEQGVGISAEQGDVVALEGFITDITERKLVEQALKATEQRLRQDIDARRKAQAELAEARDAAEAANRAKSEFLANVSHEIRTPMTAILGYVDLLAEYVPAGRLDDTITENPIEVIRQNADHLLRLIDDVLDLSKIEAGKLAIEHKPCSPEAVLAEVVSLMRPRADAKRLDLAVQWRSLVPETIRTDAMRLRQILINLVGNAVKFTESGSVRLIARIDGPTECPRLRIEVVDTGIGMTRDVLDRLFRPFTQADASTSRRFGGTGLGLSISKRLAQLLGGDLVVASAPNQGSTFTLTVPTGPLDGVRWLSADEAVALCRTRRQPQVPTVVAKLPPGCRVLLAEDGPDNQRLVSHLLRKAGAEVVVADNGQAALDLATAAVDQGRPFDVVLMDMQMPVLDGYEATRRLRASGFAGPIVAFTAHAMPEDRKKCLDCGCDDYLVKPIVREKLLATVAAQIARGAEARQTALAENDG
jgi:PAS domain S-box-containing protein